MAWYRYVNALSLDVVAGAVICTMFFARMFEVDLAIDTIFVLALAVWCIYTFDHLWDTRRSKNPLLTFRHRFHSHYYHALSFFVLICLILALTRLPFIPAETLYWGIAVSLLVLSYFLLSRFVKGPIYHKEILIAVLYTAGVLTGPLSVSTRSLSLPELILIVLFLVLAFTNLLIFAYYELEKDQQQHFPSLAGSLGKRSTRRILVFLIITVLLVGSILLAVFYHEPILRSGYMVLLAMACGLAGILNWPGVFAKHDRFRFFGDAVFFIPLIVL